jgi:hypothetical protein
VQRSINTGFDPLQHWQNRHHPSPPFSPAGHPQQNLGQIITHSKSSSRPSQRRQVICSFRTAIQGAFNLHRERLPELLDSQPSTTAAFPFSLPQTSLSREKEITRPSNWTEGESDAPDWPEAYRSSTSTFSTFENLQLHPSRSSQKKRSPLPTPNPTEISKSTKVSIVATSAVNKRPPPATRTGKPTAVHAGRYP